MDASVQPVRPATRTDRTIANERIRRRPLQHESVLLVELEVMWLGPYGYFRLHGWVSQSPVLAKPHGLPDVIAGDRDPVLWVAIVANDSAAELPAGVLQEGQR